MLSVALCRSPLAICCVKNHVCIGIGNSVHVYCIDTNELVAKLSLLGGDNIHDIVKGNRNQLIVYGGRSVRICELKFVDDVVQFSALSAIHHFDDWIVAAVSLEDKDIGWMCVLDAHNTVWIHNPVLGIGHDVYSQEQCILYGGSLWRKDTNVTVVFSGTVFQEILIWQVENGKLYHEDIPILHRIDGHKGVIFSVFYDPTLRLLSSTSDDRTIRVWEVINNNESDTDEEFDWCNSEIHSKFTIYGHPARPWKSVIAKNRIISVGEDSLMCIWSLSGELLSKVEAHHGAAIWSVNVLEDNETIVTGGADGAVILWRFEADEPSVPKTVAGDNNSFPGTPKHVFYTNSGMIVLFVDPATLIAYDTDLQETQRLSTAARYSSYSLMEISPDRKKIVLGSKDGWADLYEEYADSNVWQLRKIEEKKVMKSMLSSVKWLDNETIIVCGRENLIKVIGFPVETKKYRRSEFISPASLDGWITSGIIEKNLLICGDRGGTIFVFNLDGEDAEPAQILPKIHGRLGVQSISILDNKILSTGRDGTLRYYEIVKNEEKQHLQALHVHKLPMDWSCKILSDGGDILLFGFRELDFVIYSMNLKRFAVRMLCGGGHRYWDCRIMEDSAKFVYIKAKVVYEIDHPLRSITSKPIKKGFHTKEIYCIQPLLTSSEHNIFVSAGEDSSLRVNAIVQTQQRMETYSVTPLSKYDGHISNIKSLAVLNTENSEEYTKNLVFTGGGRAQLKIWEVRIKVDERTVESQNVTCRELLSYMLYGTDKDRKKTPPSVKKGSLAEPETRFMDISAQICHEDPNFVLLFIACSDGLVRMFVYDTINNILRLTTEFNCDNRCTLKVHSFMHNDDTILLSMTTAGFVSFWQINGNVGNLDTEPEQSTVPFTKMKIHQSGINSFDFRKIGESQYLLLSGGDDNLISLVVFEISSTQDGLLAHPLCTWESSSIHAAQVTGAKFVDGNRMLTAAIDQRVVVHSYSFVNGVLQTSKIDETMTLVPDVQGAALCCPIKTNGHTLACVYGKGFEVILLNR